MWASKASLLPIWGVKATKGWNDATGTKTAWRPKDSHTESFLQCHVVAWASFATVESISKLISFAIFFFSFFLSGPHPWFLSIPGSGIHRPWDLKLSHDSFPTSSFRNQSHSQNDGSDANKEKLEVVLTADRCMGNTMYDHFSKFSLLQLGDLGVMKEGN